MDVFAGRRLAAITEADVQALVARGETESLHLEYKRDLDITDPNKDRERNKRREFLKDVTAFANSGGGLLVFGVDEERDAANQPTGIPREICGIETENAGLLKMMLESIIASGIDEAPYGQIEVEAIALTSGKYVILVRVPSSLRAPHMVKLGGEQRFYRRVNTGSEPMTAAQIRDVVLQNAAIEERIAVVLEARRAILRKSLAGKAFFVLHLVPLVHHARRLDVTLPSVIERLNRVGCPRNRQEGPRRENQGRHTLEGYMLTDLLGGMFFRSSLFRRDGTVEFVDAYAMADSCRKKLFRHDSVVPTVHACLAAGMELYKDGVLALPVVVAVSLENFSGCAWPEWPHVPTEAERGAQLPDGNITPEPVLITNLREDYRPLMKPVWDLVWNAAGKPRCERFDERGEYIEY